VRPLKLKFQGIRSYADEVEFDFGDGAGLYFLRGSNLAESRLGSNGAGKSTVWSVLMWVLYDTTPDGLRAADLLCWWSESKSYWAEITFEIRGTVHTLRRVWSHRGNQLLLDSRPAKQVEIVELLGFDASTFLRCMLMSQDGEMFMDMLPSKKAETLSAVMNLDRWVRYADAAKVAARTVQEEIDAHRLDLQHYKGRMDALDIRSLRRKRTEEETGRKQIIKAYREMVRGARGKLAKSRDRLYAITGTIKQLERQCAQNEQAFVLATEGVKAARDAYQRQSDVVRDYKRDIRHVVDGIKLVTDLRGGACTECGQRVTKEHARQEARKLRERRSKLERKLARAESKSADLRERLTKAESVLERVRKEQREQERKLKETQVVHAKLDEIHNTAADAVEQARVNLRAERRRKNPYDEMLRTAKKTKQILFSRIDKATKRIDRKMALANRYSYWQQGFKDVRLFLFEDAIRQLEIETNSALYKLGLTDWQMHFVIDRRARKGFEHLGFDVRVLSPYNEKPVKWEVWSGGERQRLRMAGSIGFMSLVRDRTGVPFDLEVWDEPSKGLSPEGLDDLIDVLTTRARDANKRVWLVDHHTIGYGGFKHVIVAEKTAQGTTLVAE
jgi:DNA repair exonuclease SbcCD ATPase subunit